MSPKLIAVLGAVALAVIITVLFGVLLSKPNLPAVVPTNPQALCGGQPLCIAKASVLPLCGDIGCAGHVWWVITSNTYSGSVQVTLAITQGADSANFYGIHNTYPNGAFGGTTDFGLSNSTLSQYGLAKKNSGSLGIDPVGGVLTGNKINVQVDINRISKSSPTVVVQLTVQGNSGAQTYIDVVNMSNAYP